jgi:hypothetical protein
MANPRQAAKRTAEIREEIETSLHQFRENLEDVESIVAVYEKKRMSPLLPRRFLAQCSRQLRISSITTGPKKVILIHILYLSSIDSFLGERMLLSMWQADSYKTDLTNCLEDLNSSSSRLREKANIGSFCELRAVKIKASEGNESPI